MFERIKELYYDFNNNEEYARLGELPEVKDADAKICGRMKCSDKEEYLEIEELITALGAASEMQGFVYGFRYATQLMSECMTGFSEVKKFSLDDYSNDAMATLTNADRLVKAVLLHE